jgi:hypothetical protein
VKYLLFFILLISLSCKDSKQQQSTTKKDSLSSKSIGDSSDVLTNTFADTQLAERIEDTLRKLPFVKRSHEYIDSFSHHEHGMAYITDTSGNYVTVMAGYNGPERFETYYNFIVDPRTFEIKVMDPVSGDYVSVEEYIKNNKQ